MKQKLSVILIVLLLGVSGRLFAQTQTSPALSMADFDPPPKTHLISGFWITGKALSDFDINLKGLMAESTLLIMDKFCVSGFYLDREGFDIPFYQTKAYGVLVGYCDTVRDRMPIRGSISVGVSHNNSDSAHSEKTYYGIPIKLDATAIYGNFLGFTIGILVDINNHSSYGNIFYGIAIGSFGVRK